MSEGAPETREEAEARVAEARGWHERADKGLVAMFPGTMSFAVEALKAPALVNGGAAAAMLAFIGTGRQPVTADTILGLRLFGAGLLVAALATGASWIAQHLYLRSLDEAERMFHPPFLKPRVGLQRAGTAVRAVAIVLVIGAYGFAGLGMWLVSDGLVPLPLR